MTKIYWKKVVPHSMPHALQLTKQHGIEKKNMSVERIGDHLSETGDLIYKWLGTAKMPVNKVIAFEQACGINFITQYLAHSQGFLLVPAPTGRKAQHKDLIDLQAFMIEVSGLLMRNSQDKASSQETVDGIKKLMEDLAFHQRNVSSADQPQHEFALGNDNA